LGFERRGHERCVRMGRANKPWQLGFFSRLPLGILVLRPSTLFKVTICTKMKRRLTYLWVRAVIGFGVFYYVVLSFKIYGYLLTYHRFLTELLKYHRFYPHLTNIPLLFYTM
jgi:hypothetical protein